MKRILLVLLALSVLPIPVLASDESGRSAVRGVGRFTCERFLEARDEKGREFLMAGGFVDGYLTAVNQYNPDVFAIAPWQSTGLLVDWLAAHCAKAPETPFVRAVSAMARSLGPLRLKEFSEVIEARVGENSIIVYQETMRQVQERLTELGHYTGTVDGLFGPATQDALEKYQAANNLTPTGLPDQVTLLRIYHAR